MKLKKVIGKCLYQFIGRHLPNSHSKFSLGAKCFRSFCGKLMLDSCGNNVNIERGAVLPVNVRLGNNSGIGKKCVIGGVQL